MSAFEGWGVLELLGHRIRYGCISEVTAFGESFCRIDIPTDPPTFELYAGKSIYGWRPATEEAVRRYHQPQRLDRPALSGPVDAVLVEDDDDGERAGTVKWCGGCDRPLRFGEPTQEVVVDNDDVETWHEQCAQEHAEPDDEPLPDPIDSDAPVPGFSAELGLKVCAHDGVTPNDSVVANRRAGEEPR